MEVVNWGYVLVVPGIILGVLCILVFLRRAGLTTAVAHLIDSCGIIFVAWLLLRGWRQTFADWRRFLSTLDDMYGAWAPVVAFFMVVGFCVLVHVLAERERRQKNWDRMHNESYRKMEEERWKIEKQLRSIEDRQEYFVRHGMKW
jgi:TRAP-type C4-dicarboxylate transport system permease small subunit